MTDNAAPVRVKGYLVDPFERTVSPVEYERDNLDQIYTMIGCDRIDAVALPNGDTAFVDDEGLLKDPTHFVIFDGIPQPLAGRALIVGDADADGNTTSATCSIEWVSSNVKVAVSANALARESGERTNG